MNAIPAADYPARGYAWTVVAILVATAILSYTDRQVLSLLVDPIRADLGISDTQISLLLGTAFAVVYGVAGIPLGWLADRTSRRNLIFCGVLVWTIGTLACGLSQSFGQLFAGRLVVGLGEAVLSPAAISLISDYFPPSRRGTAVACFLSGIAMGIGAAILIGGGVLHFVQLGALAGTPLAHEAPWRMVLLLIGAPGLLWALVILAIREPVRRGVESDSGAGRPGGGAPKVGPAANAATARAALDQPVAPAIGWSKVIPIYAVVAIASLVDNAVGAWAPTLLTREFHMDRAQVGMELGIMLTAAFGGGVLIGGWLADRAGVSGGWSRKLLVCLTASGLILPVAAALNAANVNLVLPSIPAYFALSGIVTACGFSAILDVVPNRSRGLAMSISFFLNVAIGGAVGPTAVAMASDRIFGAEAGLGPAIAMTVAIFYGAAIVALIATRTGRAAHGPS
ncbi:MAG: MFS transporter [Proteobacteria bacterium]|nr:MFS transporter [Pseudomonadota bacterium]